MTAFPEATIGDLTVAAYRIPTESPEADGTMTWDETTVVVVTAHAAGEWGLGFTYGSSVCASLIHDTLAPEVVGRDALNPAGAWDVMVKRVRNIGRPGIASMAIAAVDVALWDLNARLFDLPLFRLLGPVRTEAPVYGSGGFTSLSEAELVDQLAGWVADGIPRVKMKIGMDWGHSPHRDLARTRLVRKAIGDGPDLFVDANGAYAPKQAVRLASEFEALGATWYEEPVSSDHHDVLHEIRGRTSMAVAAGEYGYDLAYFAHLCAAGAVDVVQADVSRCAGITEWRRVAAVTAGHGLGISGHCAQSLHAHVACSAPNLVHLEYFADHARVDRLLFEGVLDPHGGALRPDPDRPGIGLSVLPSAERWRVI